MKEIKMTRGFGAIVDDEDFEELSKHRWYCDSRGYAVRKLARDGGRQKALYVHIAILGNTEGLEIDHINGNPLDNRRENLRHVTHQQNIHNRKPVGASSQYKGVCWYKRDCRWLARIVLDGKRTHLGYYKLEMDAARAYNEAARVMFGEYARLNVMPIFNN